MKAKITDVRIQRLGGGGGGGTSGTTSSSKPENVDILSGDQDLPERNPDGTTEGGNQGQEEVPGEYKQVWVAPEGSYVHGEVLPAGELEKSKEGKTILDEKDLDARWGSISTGGYENAPYGIRRALERLRKPVIDWRNALDKFIDQAISKSKYDLPNRRFLAGGEAQYGYKTYREDFNTVVVAIDTSGSISRKMIETFLSETVNITTIYNPQKTVIIYCSDYIDDVDIIEPGESPDLNKIKSTTGNFSGFLPPFQWVEENLLNHGDEPSVFIYFTDGHAHFPNEKQFEISRYSDRCIWVFLTFTGEPYTNPQPFGERIDIALANKTIEEI